MSDGLVFVGEDDAMGTQPVVETHGAQGLIWLAGWLFTIGFVHLSFWRGVLAILIWPYYIGVVVRGFIH